MKLSEEILDSIDNIYNESYMSEALVINSMLATYEKSAIIMESYTGTENPFEHAFFMEADTSDDTQQEKSFTEKFKDNFRKIDDKTGNPESIFISIIKFIPRLVGMIIDKIGKWIKKMKDKHQLEKAKKTQEYLDSLDKKTKEEMDKEWENTSDEDKETDDNAKLKKKKQKIKIVRVKLYDRWTSMWKRNRAEADINKIKNLANQPDFLKYKVKDNSLKIPINFSALNNYIAEYIKIIRVLDDTIKPKVEDIDFSKLSGLHIVKYDPKFYTLKQYNVVTAIEEMDKLEDNLTKLYDEYKKVYPKTVIFRETKMWYQRGMFDDTNNSIKDLQKASGGQPKYYVKNATKSVQTITKVLGWFTEVIPELFDITQKIREGFKNVDEVPKLAKEAIDQRKEQREDEEYEKRERREEKERDREFNREKKEAERQRELRKINKDDDDKKGDKNVTINIGSNKDDKGDDE